MTVKRWGKMLLAGFVAMVAIVGVAGCQQKEPIVKVKGPAGSVDVERNKGTGDVNVDIKREKDKSE